MNAILRPVITTVADLLDHLAVPPQRVRMKPTPGFATEEDAIHNKHCELIDGVLVEKAMGYYESRMAFVLIRYLGNYLEIHDLGIGLDGSGMIRVSPAQIRLPDVSFISWEHFPNRKLPWEQILDLTPDFAVEILSPSNTVAEMIRKRGEYFTGGAKLVWEVDPAQRTVAVYTSPDDVTILDESATLDGGEVLPGFTLSIREWFARAGERGA